MNHSPAPHFLSSEIENTELAESRFTVLPVPYEKTVSYGEGTARGPRAILDASEQLEVWDGTGNPAQAGIHTRPEVDCADSPEVVLERVASEVACIVSAGSIPVILGGEHTVTWGVVQGLLQAYSIGEIGVVQIDAHADLRDEYEGDKYSHACVIKRIVDAGVPVHQLGVRALCEQEQRLRDNSSLITFQDARDIVPAETTDLQLPENFPPRVFLTIDVDGFDPSVFPATGTPVPGGLGWYQGLSLIESLLRQREVLGFDVMEFSPIDGFPAWDFSAAALVYRVMGMLDRSQSA